MDVREWLDADMEELALCLEQVDCGQIAALGEEILRSRQVFVAGAGRSGLVMRMAALRLMQLGLSVFVVGDVTAPASGPGDLLIVGSASGETAGVLALARRAQELGARVAALTARPTSSIAMLAERRVIIRGTTPKATGGPASRLPMASVLEQAFLVVVDALVAWLAAHMGQTDGTMMARHANLE